MTAGQRNPSCAASRGAEPASLVPRLANEPWTQPASAYRITVCWVAGDQAGRVDSWIWSVRLTRTRSAASGACRAGHVRVNGVRVKPAHAVRAGDEVRLRDEGRERVVVVQQVITKRVSPLLPPGAIPTTALPLRRARRLWRWLPATAARAVRPSASAEVSRSCSGGRPGERTVGRIGRSLASRPDSRALAHFE